MDLTLSIRELLELVSHEGSEGEADVDSIRGVASLDEATKGDLAFLGSVKFLHQLESSSASVVLLAPDIEASPKSGQLFVRTEKPSLELAKVCERIAARMWTRPEPGIHPSAVIDPTAEIGVDVSIGPFVVVEKEVRIGRGSVIGARSFLGEACSLGEHCWLSSNVNVERDSRLGKRVRLHPGAVIGSDGFGYELQEGRHEKIPQVGNVEIGDDVEIGANTCIDRGRLGATRIGEGSKIDNLVQIGHNVQVGKHCILCAQVGIAGSSKLGDYVVMGGRAGASGHLDIGAGSQLAGQCVAFSDLEPGGKWGGAPAMPLVAYQRMLVLTRRLPDLFKRLKRLESQILEK